MAAIVIFSADPVLRRSLEELRAKIRRHSSRVATIRQLYSD